MPKISQTSLIAELLVPNNDKIISYGLPALAFLFFFNNLYHWAEFLFLTLVIFWIVQRVRSGTFHVVRTSLDLPILLFLLWILITLPFAVDPAYSFHEWQKTLPRFLIFWFVVCAIRTEDHVRSVLFAFVLGLGVLSLLEVIHFVFVEGGHPFDKSQRAGSFTGSSQWLSNYLVIGWPIILLGFNFDNVPWIRLIYVVIFGLTSVAILLVHTRASWVAIFVQLSVLGALKISRKGMIAMGIVILMLGGFIMGIFVKGDPIQVIDSKTIMSTYSMQVRLNTWKFAIDEMKQNALVGIGYGKHSFQKAYPDLNGKFHTHIHNVFLSKAVQLGILGLILFLWIFVKVFKKSYHGFRNFEHQYTGKLALAVLISTAGLMVRSMFDDMFSGSIVYLFWLLVGLLIVQLQIEFSRKKIEGFSRNM